MRLPEMLEMATTDFLKALSVKQIKHQLQAKSARLLGVSAM